MDSGDTGVCEWSKGRRNILDLDSLAFHRLDYFCDSFMLGFPPDTLLCNDLEDPWIFYVPALKAQEESLKKVSQMPIWTEQAFEGIFQLNSMQSKVYEKALVSPENILVCAPTGAVKTNVAVMTILQQIRRNEKVEGFNKYAKCKIVYVTPTEALVAQLVASLSNRLHHYGVHVEKLSEDQTSRQVQTGVTHIIVTTPEKWERLARMQGDLINMENIKLLILDDIHVLQDYKRGPLLESIVARMFLQMESTKHATRLVGLSATLANCTDIAEFLKVDLDTGLFRFDNSYRHVPLDQEYAGIKEKKRRRSLRLMNQLCYEYVISEAEKGQVLIFCHSTQDIKVIACGVQESVLANETLSMLLEVDSSSREILQSHTELVESDLLKYLLPHRCAIHHPGLVRADRQIVEELFRDGHIQILVSSAILAWECTDLYAHTVIIKGTTVYNPETSLLTELSPLDFMQMLGRAGRPQFDTSGKGIVITEYDMLDYYITMMNHNLGIESQFISKLTDHLNAEIVLGTVQNAQEAMNWLAYTYLYVCMRNRCTRYGISLAALKEDVILEDRVADLVHSAATLLDENNLVKYDRKSGNFQVTNFLPKECDVPDAEDMILM